MMRFPALLTAKLARARIAHPFQLGQHRRLLEYLEPADVLHPNSSHPVSHEKIRDIIASPTPVIWIGGNEPLDHPGIAHLVRALAPSGHYFFLETSGALLRRRIHEFQPLPRFFLTVRLDPAGEPHSELAVEGLRAARLSGFFSVVHSLVRENSDLADFARMRTLLLERDVDGWLITAASANPAVVAPAAAARKSIPSAAWRRFSRLVERKLIAQERGREALGVPIVEKMQREVREESVKVA